MTNQRAPTIFIVDDDEAVRGSLRLLFKSLGYTALAYGSAAEFLDHYDPDQPGCAVLDVRMPGMSGLQLQDELNRRGALLPLIFITGHGDVPMAVEAMRRGAFDFLQKPFRHEDLIDRIRGALARDRELREQSLEKGRIQARLRTLTRRETQVLKLLTQGRSNKLMAAELGVSQRTVEIHRAHVMEKMGAGSIAELVRMALLAGIRSQDQG